METDAGWLFSEGRSCKSLDKVLYQIQIINSNSLNQILVLFAAEIIKLNYFIKRNKA